MKNFFCIIISFYFKDSNCRNTIAGRSTIFCRGSRWSVLGTIIPTEMTFSRANIIINYWLILLKLLIKFFFLDKPMDHFGEKNPVITAEAESSVDDESLNKEQKIPNPEPQPFLRWPKFASNLLVVFFQIVSNTNTANAVNFSDWTPL